MLLITRLIGSIATSQLSKLKIDIDGHQMNAMGMKKGFKRKYVHGMSTG